MRRGSRKKIVVLFVLILLVIVYIITVFFSQERPLKIKYSEFYSMVENGEVEIAELSESAVNFKIRDDKTFYITDNPQKDDFLEFLLLHNVEVAMEVSISSLLYTIMDVLFLVIFLVFLIFFAYKLLKNKTFHVIKHVNASFDNVIGMEGLKKEFYQIVDVMKNPEKYKRQGIHMPRGILLEGAPGNGKTLFARAAAGECNISFIPAKATDFESMFMAVGPMKVKQLFRLARKHAPCIIFIDEFDGIGSRRSYGQTAMETENIRIVTALLNELDGFTENNGVLVLAATNNRKALDEALIRPGRFDRKYVVPYPDFKDRLALLEMYTKGKKLAKDVELQELARIFDNCSCAKIEVILNQAALLAERRGSGEVGQVEIMMAFAEVN